MASTSELPLEIIGHEVFSVGLSGKHQQGSSSFSEVGSYSVVRHSVLIVVQVLGQNAACMEQFFVWDLFLGGYRDPKDLDVF